MKFLFKKLTSRFYFVPMVLAVVIVGVFLVANTAYAQNIEKWTLRALGSLTEWLVEILGKLLLLLIDYLIKVFSYNGFISSTAVSTGWILVRDISNMFFVVALLIIAFATVFKIENYQARRMLPKLILMALLVNFSKTICGLLIDVGQVIMMTFVNSFKTIVAGNLAYAFGIKEMMEVIKFSGDNIDFSFGSVVGAYFLALLLLVVAIGVTLVMGIILIFRIIMLWALVVLSPLAYIAAAVPGGQQYSSKWWSEFSKYVIVGPMLAFFFWLSMQVIYLSNEQAIIDIKVKEDELIETGVDESTSALAKSQIAVAATKISTGPAIFNFIVATSLLIASMILAQQMGVAGGKFAGSFMGKLQTLGLGFVGGLAAGALLPLRGAKAGAEYGLGKFAKKTGVDLMFFKKGRGWDQLKEKWAENRAKDYLETIKRGGERLREGKFGARLGALGNVKYAYEAFTGKKIVDFLRGPRRMKKRAEEMVTEAKEAEDEAKFARELQYSPGQAVKSKTQNLINKNMQEHYDAEARKREFIKEKNAALKEGDTTKAAEIDQQIKKEETHSFSSEWRAQQLKDYLSSHPDDYFEKKGRGILANKKSKIDQEAGRLESNPEALTKAEEIKRTERVNQIDKLIKGLENRELRVGSLTTQEQTDLDALRTERKQLDNKDASGHYFATAQEKADPAREAMLSKETENLRKESRLLDKQLQITKPVSDEERLVTQREAVKKESEAGRLRREAEMVRMPKDWHGAAARRALEAEEMKKLEGVENWQEHISYAQDALRNKDKVRFMAAFKKAAKDYNDNEFLEYYHFPSNAPGMKQFTEEMLIKRLGMSEQEANAGIDDVSYINESRNHWETARLMKHENGRIEWKSEEEHATEALAEMLKIGPRMVVRDMNRLAHGGHYFDPETGEKKYELAPLGMALLKALAPDFAHGMTRAEANKNYLANLSTIIEQIKRVPEIWYARTPDRRHTFAELFERVKPAQPKVELEIRDAYQNLGRKPYY